MTRMTALILLIAMLFSSGTAAITQWYVMPGAVERDGVIALAGWTGVPVSVVDARPRPVIEPVIRWVDAGLSWDGYSGALVDETLLALRTALGPARPAGGVEVRVAIREHISRLAAPRWVGSTVLDVSVVMDGRPVGPRWTIEGHDARWNLWGMETARIASQRAFELAVHDVLRRLAATAPPRA
jgi:hypothetical protein